MTKIAGASAALQEEREQEQIAQRSALNWKASHTFFSNKNQKKNF